MNRNPIIIKFFTPLEKCNTHTQKKISNNSKTEEKESIDGFPFPFPRRMTNWVPNPLLYTHTIIYLEAAYSAKASNVKIKQHDHCHDRHDLSEPWHFSFSYIKCACTEERKKGSLIIKSLGKVEIYPNWHFDANGCLLSILVVKPSLFTLFCCC